MLSPHSRSLVLAAVIAVGLAATAACRGHGPVPSESEPPAHLEPELRAEWIRGIEEARAQIRSGSFALLVPSAIPVPWMHAIRVEEHAKFGIDYRLTGDVVNPLFEAYRDGYNTTMERAVRREHGEDVFDRIRAGIDRRMQEGRPAPRSDHVPACPTRSGQLARDGSAVDRPSSAIGAPRSASVVRS